MQKTGAESEVRLKNRDEGERNEEMMKTCVGFTCVMQERKKVNRTLTQKYDMHALRALQKLEADLLRELAEVHGVPEGK